MIRRSISRIVLSFRKIWLILAFSAFIITLYGQIQTFTVSGNFTVPAGVTSLIVECWGAGGGGGSSNSAFGSRAGGGGGGGGYSASVVTVTPGNTYNIVVGTGGAGGNNSAGTTGGNSSFDGTAVVANGGIRGLRGGNGARGTGGAPGTGTTLYSGGNGAAGVNATGSGGGGGGAGSSGNGGNASGVTAGSGTVLNGGNGGAGRSGASLAGNDGNNYGGGGSGGYALANGGDQLGGDGANGYVVLTWAVPYFSQGSGNPSLLTNWNSNPGGGGSTPPNFTGNNQAFLIQNGHTMTTTGAVWTVSGTNTKVEILSGGTLTETASAVSLSANTSLQVDNGGTLNHNVNSLTIFSGPETFGNTSTVNYGFGGAQTVSSATYGNLILSASGAKTIAGVTVNGVLSMEGTATASAAPAYGATATLQYNTATARTAGAEWINTFAATGGVIIANTGVITLNAARVFSSGVQLTINSGASLNTSAANNYAITFGGNYINNGGSLIANGSLITIASAMAVQDIAGFITTGNVTMTKTAGTATFTGNINGNGLTINGNGGTLNLGTGLTHTFTGAWTNTIGTLNGGSSILIVGNNGAFAGGTFTCGTGTVTYNSAGVQTVAGVVYNNLSTSGAGTKTLGGATTVGGTFNPGGAGISIGANTLTLNGQINCGTLTGGVTSNIIIGGAGSASLSEVTLNDLTINRTVSLCGNVTVGGTLTLTSGTFTVGANTLTLNGPAIGGTPANLSTSSSSNLTFGGSDSGVQIPSSVSNLNNLSVNNVNGITLNGSVTVSNILTMTQGNIITGSNTLILSNSTSGNLSYSTGTITGKFQRAIGSTGTQYLFPVGTASNYNPLKITFSNLTAGQLSVQFLPADIGTNGLPLNDAGTEIFDRQTTGYWTLAAIAPLASGNYNVNLNYTGFTGVDGLARVVKRTNGGNLTLDGTHGTVSAPEITRLGLNGISSTTTDFAIGKPGLRITSQPQNFTGCNATFSITVSGKSPLTYKWQEDNGGGFTDITNGGIYSGATTSSLAISGAEMLMNGYLYRCIVTDALGYSVTSNSALLTITQVSFGYQYSSNITLDPASGPADLTDFPALISIITSPDCDRLRTTGNGGHVSSSSGYDIIFTDQSDNKLDHEIESYDAATGQYVAWIRIPLLSHTASTTIKMLYGNPTVGSDPSVTSVWTSNYKGIWHLNGTDYSDATINANNGAQNATTNVTGRIAGGRGFNGTTSYISVTTSGFVPNDNNQTISIWANYSATPGGNRNLITFQNTGASSAIQFGFRGGNTVAWKWGGALLADAGAAPSINTWHYYVYTFDGTTSRIYVDGVERDNSTVAPQTAMPTEGNIGRYNNGEYLAASLDEPRFSMSSKSAGWILTEYNNQNDPVSFILLGSENVAPDFASIGVCSTTYTLDQGYPSGGTYSGPGVSGTNFNASVAGVGTHQITYSYSDAYGCSFSVNRNITVTPAPSSPAASNGECCVSNITDLEATGTNLRWYTDAGLTTLVGTGTPFATGRTTAGVYTYYVTQTINGCESTSSTVSLTIFNGINITAQPQLSTICEGGNTGFSVAASGFNITYQWQEDGVNITNGGIYSGATTLSLSLTNPGLAKNGRLYRCVISSPCGSSPVNSNSAQLTVTAQPVATFSYSGTPYCPNAANPLPTFSGGGVAGIFSSTAGLVFINSSTGEINIAGSTPGNYIVTNTIAPSGGCGEVIATSPFSIISDFVWSGAAGTDWNNSGNWTCGLIPTQAISVQIPDVPNKPVLNGGASGAVRNLTIDAGSSLIITGNTLQISESISNNGTFTSTDGTIELNGTAAQNLNANTFAGNTIKNLTVNNSAGVSLLGSLDITGIVNVQNGNLSSGGFLTLVSSASGTALIDGSGAGSVTGNVTMQRYLPSGFGYKYIASPFTSSTVNELADEVNLLYSFPLIYRYNENRTSSGWVSYVKPDSILKPMTGYSANFGTLPAPVTADITGTVNNGNLSLTLYNHNRTYTQGYNLVGNPYPSAIDWNVPVGWTKINIENALYYFEASGTDQYGGIYRTYINGVSSGGNASNIIPSMQAFFVRVSVGAYPVTATLGMTNEVRVTDATHPFIKGGIKTAIPLIRLISFFSDDTASTDPFVAYIDEKASGQFDSNLDARKLMNTDLKVPNLYSVSPEGDKLSINALPVDPEFAYTLPLGLKLNRSGQIVFKIRNIHEQFTSAGVYLTDLAMGTVTDLINDKEYTVNLISGEYLNRFVLDIGSVMTSIPETSSGENIFSAWSWEGLLKMNIKRIFSGSGLLKIFNLTGQILLEKRYDAPGLYEFNPGLKDGFYIVSFYSGRIMKSVKIYYNSR